jgi:hypothetical protein
MRLQRKASLMRDFSLEHLASLFSMRAAAAAVRAARRCRSLCRPSPALAFVLDARQIVSQTPCSSTSDRCLGF